MRSDLTPGVVLLLIVVVLLVINTVTLLYLAVHFTDLETWLYQIERIR